MKSNQIRINFFRHIGITPSKTGLNFVCLPVKQHFYTVMKRKTGWRSILHRGLLTSLPHVTKSGYEENRNCIVKYIIYIIIALERKVGKALVIEKGENLPWHAFGLPLNDVLHTAK